MSTLFFFVLELGLFNVFDQADETTDLLVGVGDDGSTSSLVNDKGRSGVLGSGVQPEVAARVGHARSSGTIVVGDKEDAAGSIECVPLALGEGGAVSNGSNAGGEDEQTLLTNEAEGNHSIVVVVKEVFHLGIGEGTPAIVGNVTTVGDLVATPLVIVQERGGSAVSIISVTIHKGSPNRDIVALHSS